MNRNQAIKSTCNKGKSQYPREREREREKEREREREKKIGPWASMCTQDGEYC